MILTKLDPQIEKLATIIGLSISVIALMILIIWIILTLIGFYKQDEMQKDYIKKLNDHEKAIIKEYETLKWNPFKRNIKK